MGMDSPKQHKVWGFDEYLRLAMEYWNRSTKWTYHNLRKKWCLWHIVCSTLMYGFTSLAQDPQASNVNPRACRIAGAWAWMLAARHVALLVVFVLGVVVGNLLKPEKKYVSWLQWDWQKYEIWGWGYWDLFLGSLTCSKFQRAESAVQLLTLVSNEAMLAEKLAYDHHSGSPWGGLCQSLGDPWCNKPHTSTCSSGVGGSSDE